MDTVVVLPKTRANTAGDSLAATEGGTFQRRANIPSSRSFAEW